MGSTSLNDSGKTIMADADAGFNPVRNLMNSKESKKLSAQRQEAVHRRIWEMAGLAKPENDFGKAAAEFASVFFAVEQGGDDWPDRLAAEAKGKPLLAGIDWAAAATAFRSRKEESHPDAPATRLPIATARSPKDGESFEMAFHSRQGRSLRILAATAALAVVTAVGFHGMEYHRAKERDMAYAAMKMAAESRNPVAVMEQVGVFLGAAPMTGKDLRTQEVGAIYSRAFVDWFATMRGNAPDEKGKTILDTYRRLSSTFGGREI